MSTRIKINEVAPAGYKAMLAMEGYVESVKDISPLHKDLIRIRASQLNGCAFCIDMHTKSARKLGETEQRIYLLNAWRESPQFTDEEKVILAMTEEVTLISRAGLTDETYAAAIAAFGPDKTASIIMMIIAINGWNRIGIATRMAPGQ